MSTVLCSREDNTCATPRRRVVLLTEVWQLQDNVFLLSGLLCDVHYYIALLLKAHPLWALVSFCVISVPLTALFLSYFVFIRRKLIHSIHKCNRTPQGKTTIAGKCALKAAIIYLQVETLLTISDKVLLILWSPTVASFSCPFCTVSRNTCIYKKGRQPLICHKVMVTIFTRYCKTNWEYA